MGREKHERFNMISIHVPTNGFSQFLSADRALLNDCQRLLFGAQNGGEQIAVAQHGLTKHINTGQTKRWKEIRSENQCQETDKGKQNKWQTRIVPGNFSNT